MVKKKKEEKSSDEIPEEVIPVDTMKIVGEREIALDFATKVYEAFDQMIKSVILFGSSAKRVSTPDSDIDIIIIIDDISIKWDPELISWYREELGKTLSSNPYKKSLHINSVKLSTWWDDMLKGDPTILNIIRFGDALIDFGGFFSPLKLLLKEGKIRSTPEAIYTLLQRAPAHLTRANQAMLSAVDGFYWTMVDSAHAALISAEVMPSSPEEIAGVLEEVFVKTGKLNKKYIKSYEEIRAIEKEIMHGKVSSIKGKVLDEAFEKADEFLKEMARLVNEMIETKNNIKEIK